MEICRSGTASPVSRGHLLPGYSNNQPKYNRYWDWTDKNTEDFGLPDVLRPQSFTFELPGPPKTNYSTIENPLAGFEFGTRIPEGFSNKLWKSPVTQAPAVSYNEDWRRTYRWPTSKVNPTEDYLKIQE